MKRYIQSAKTLEDYENMGVFDMWQMEEIREGLEKGVDVSVYADPKYNSSQMAVIIDGLEEGLDISWYADPKYDWGQMLVIYKGLKKGLDVSVYADPKYTDDQMEEILEGLEKGVDVSVYLDLKPAGSYEVSEAELYEAGYEDIPSAQEYDSSLKHLAWMESEDVGIFEKVKDINTNDVLYVQVSGRGRIYEI